MPPQARSRTAKAKAMARNVASQMHPLPPSLPFRFMDLPPEIRLLIYEIFFRHDEPIDIIVNRFRRRCPYRAIADGIKLLRTSKQIRSESLRFLYSKNVFKTSLSHVWHPSTHDVQPWIDELGSNAGLLTHLILRVSVESCYLRSGFIEVLPLLNLKQKFPKCTFEIQLADSGEPYGACNVCGIRPLNPDIQHTSKVLNSAVDTIATEFAGSSNLKQVIIEKSGSCGILHFKHFSEKWLVEGEDFTRDFTIDDDGRCVTVSPKKLRHLYGRHLLTGMNDI